MNYKKESYKMDEMQKLQLLKLERYSFWIAFWALCAAVVIQALIGTSFREIAGEMAVLLIAGGCIAVSCLKNGLWAQNYRPSAKTSAAFSGGATLALGAVFAVRSILVLHKPIAPDLAGRIALLMAAAFGACFGLLELGRAIYKRRRERLDDVEEGGR